MPVVVVESPAKAKTINAYLGSDYTVLASFGHVRDLPPRDGSVDPEQGFRMEWEVDADARKHLKAIADALKDDPRLILATDPDREGEAISWHLTEALRDRKAIKKDTAVSRVTFNAITKAAVAEAMKHPREVDAPLVDAYLARRALDYLVGFNLSPVLWRKLPGAKSAGRVQSVCLRLIVEREMEIEAFRAQEYWDVVARFATPRGRDFEARLTLLGGKKVEKFTLADATAAELAVHAVESRRFHVASVEASPASRNPAAPFMTSTLQQEASRKFGFGAKATMSAAQRLYEAGHITYMRTDGIDMAPEAVMAARDAIRDRFGEAYVPKSPRMYKNKAKNAQEAHECIRPTDMTRDVDSLRISDGDQRRLYDLIWKRTIASQMEAMRLERTVVEVRSEDGEVGLRATGSRILFDGFFKVYVEGRDDEGEGEDGAILPQIMPGEPAAFSTASYRPDFLKARDPSLPPDEGQVIDDSDRGERHARAILAANEAVLSLRHFTQPPPRYTEATLVKRMEELGIGRPSTYASIVTTIQDRGYVEKDGGRLVPQDKGRLVTAFLTNYFRRYVEYDFTAGLEDQLDQVSAGEADYKDVLGRFWRDFSAAIAETADLRIGEVLDKIDEVLSPHLYPRRADGGDPRECPVCHKGRLSMRTARTGGAFIGCSNYPECRYTRPFGPPSEDGEAATGDRVLGEDGGQPILLKDGRFGPYVQRGEATADNPKPPRASLPKGWTPQGMNLERALRLLSLPRVVGNHPEDGEPVEAGIGRYGPYVKHGATYANLPEVDEAFVIGMNRALDVLAQKALGRGGRARGAAPSGRALGDHPDGGAISVMPGRFGPYVKWGKVNATIPKGADPEALTLVEAVALVDAKAGAGGGARKGKPKAAAKPKAAPAAKAKAPAAKPKVATASPKPGAKAAKPRAARAKAAPKDAPKGVLGGLDVIED